MWQFGTGNCSSQVRAEFVRNNVSDVSALLHWSVESTVSHGIISKRLDLRFFLFGLVCRRKYF
jgi:hypothetical protein